MPRNPSIRYILTEKQLAILGEIATASAQLESTVGFMLMLVLQFNVTDHSAIVEPMSLSTRLDVLKSVGRPRIKSKKRSEEFSKLMDHLKICAVQRNVAIHGLWGPEGGARLGDLMAIASGHMKPQSVEAKNKKRVFKAAKLEQLAKDLEEGSTALWDIAKATWLKRQLRADRKVKPVDALAAAVP